MFELFNNEYSKNRLEKARVLRENQKNPYANSKYKFNLYPT